MSQDIIRIRFGQQIYRSITLPMRGTVLVRTGQRLNAGDLIAECSLPEKYLVFDVVNSLKINAKRMEASLTRLVGEQVEAGDMIAQKPGLFSRIFRAPQNGKVISIRDGKVTLALGTKKLQVFAPFPGMVVELVPERGVVLGGSGAVLEGVWGNGINSHGILVYLGGSEKTPFDQTTISPDLADKIVVMGYCDREELLDTYEKSHIAGLIVSSFAPDLMKKIMLLRIPFISLAGFGEIVIDDFSETMILKMMGQEVFMNANLPDIYTGLKPEVFMPLAQVTNENLFVNENALRVGSKVRLIGKPYSGNVGEVIDLPDEKERFASGLWVYPAVLRRADGEVIRIPVSNIEIIVS